MPLQEALLPNRIKFHLEPYYPVCTPTGYRCVCNTEESNCDDMVITYQPMPQAHIKHSWFQPQPESARMTPQTLAKMTPQGESAPNSPRPERTQRASEQMESHWDEELDLVPDYPSRPYNDRRNPCPLRRQNFVIRRPTQRWPKYNSNCTPHTCPKF